jgi:hypothetical protein
LKPDSAKIEVRGLLLIASDLFFVQTACKCGELKK